MHLGRIKRVAAQKSEVPLRQIIHALLHESDFLFSDFHVAHQVDLLLHKVRKSLGIDRLVAVEERIFHLSTRIGLQNIVLAAESVSIVVGEMPDDLSHIYEV